MLIHMFFITSVLQFATIPSGSFQKGSLEGNADEKPVQTVFVREFEISTTEITISDYLRCMADGICEAPTWWQQGYFETVSDSLSNTKKMQIPITGINWKQAMAFCSWLGPEYRLPTEAEWEYAAGGARGFKYPWGNDPDRHIQFESFHLNPVASHVPNTFGLFDMEGNAWEWTYDCYDALESDGSCKRHVTKGGSWSEHIWNLRVANKSYGLTNLGYKTLGFRVVRNAK